MERSSTFSQLYQNPRYAIVEADARRNGGRMMRNLSLEIRAPHQKSLHAPASLPI
jgi:hypothetical protein